MLYGKGVAKQSYRQRPAYHAMLLGCMAMFTSALIVVGNKQTEPEIELRLSEDIKNSLAQVIPPAMHTNDLLQDEIQLKLNDKTKIFYLAKSYDNIVGVAFDMSAQGYAGPISVILGINRKGELLGTRVLSHNETPGLGDKIEPEKNPWIFGFNGLSLKNPGESQWKVKKDGGYFDQFTGATITPRAVIKAIKSGLELFRDNKTVLFAEAAPQKAEEKTTLTKPPETESTTPKVGDKDSHKVLNPTTSQTTTTQKNEPMRDKSNG